MASEGPIKGLHCTHASLGIQFTGHCTTEVHLWHGELDLNVPVSVGRYVADIIPNCQAMFFEGEGHFTLSHRHLREILSVLVD